MFNRKTVTNLQNKVLPLIIIVAIGITGAYLLTSTHAASPYASLNANTGTLAGGAVAQSDSTASDGTKVLFNGTNTGTQTSNCFPSPSACGYPDPASGNVGASDCSQTAVNAPSITSGGTIQNLHINGGISVSVPNVTINNVCITDSDGGDGALGITIGSGATNLLIEHTTVGGTSSTNALDTGIWNANDVPSVTANYVYIYNAAEDWHGSGTVTNSYMQAGSSYSGSHNEDIYLSDTSITLTHDTLLNSTGQTAVLFGDNYGGGSTGPGTNHWTVTNSLMGGGGWMAYWNARGTSVGSSTMDVENNRWVRCLGTQHFDGSGTTCSGLGDGANDGHGYFPFGGYYGNSDGVFTGDFCPPTAGQTWSNNVWDDNNAPVSC